MKVKQTTIQKNKNILDSLAAIIKIIAMRPAIAKRLCTPVLEFGCRPPVKNLSLLTLHQNSVNHYDGVVCC